MATKKPNFKETTAKIMGGGIADIIHAAANAPRNDDGDQVADIMEQTGGDGIPQEPAEPGTRRGRRPRNESLKYDAANPPKSAKGLKEGYNRVTAVMRVEQFEKIRAVSYWEKIPVRDVMEQLLDAALNLYESKNGEIRPIPEKEGGEESGTNNKTIKL
jgi:hypothetical protein